MTFTVFIPHSVAHRCYLIEALDWVANRRFPLEAVTENNEDVREDSDYVDGLTPELLDEEPLTDEECAFVGLPPNPEWQCFVNGEYHMEPDRLRDFLKIATSEADINRIEKELIESERFYSRQEEWDSAYDDFLDLYKSRLFLALREGRMSAIGKPLPQPTYESSFELLEQTDWEGWSETKWNQIPSDFWISTKINWSECWAEGKQTAYCLILVECEPLFKQFPPPTELATSIFKVGRYFALDSSDSHSSSGIQSRGRPRLDWDGFYLEIVKRLQDGSIPEKQEAFIAEMQEWCRANWHRDVGRSTLSQKLKPYYDTFIRKPKNT